MNLRITVGTLSFAGRLELERAPKTCRAFLAGLPLHARLVQARWSGEAAWIPLGDRDFAVPSENPVSHPAPGQLLLYLGGDTETEILFPYGVSVFRNLRGQLAGNHFLTVVEGTEQFIELGRRVWWEGAQEIVFEADET